MSRIGEPQRLGGPETGATCSGPLAWLYRKSVLSRGVVAPSASDRGQPLFFTIKNGLANPRGAPASKFFFGLYSRARPVCRVPLLAPPSSASFSSPLRYELSIHGRIRDIKSTQQYTIVAMPPPSAKQA